MVIAPARRAGDPGSIPGPGENFSLKLLIEKIIFKYKVSRFVHISNQILQYSNICIKLWFNFSLLILYGHLCELIVTLPKIGKERGNSYQKKWRNLRMNTRFTYIYSLLIKKDICIVKMFQLSFRVFKCAFHLEFSSFFFCKSVLFLFLFFCVICTAVLSFPRSLFDSHIVSLMNTALDYCC